MIVRIDNDKSLYEFLEEAGNMHTENDIPTYFYLPFVFMIRGGELYQLSNSEVPIDVKHAFIKSVP